MIGTCGRFGEFLEHNDRRYNNIKENIAVAYLKAICAYSRLTLERKYQADDIDHIDVIIHCPKIENDDVFRSRPLIHFQLKTTSVPVCDSD